MQSTNELNFYSFLGAGLTRSYLKLGNDLVTLGTTSSDIMKLSHTINGDGLYNTLGNATGTNYDQVSCQPREYVTLQYGDTHYNVGVQDAI